MSTQLAMLSRRTLLVGAFLMLCIVSGRSLMWISAETSAGPHRDKVERWAAGLSPWTSDEWDLAQTDIATAARVLPEDASLQDMLGSLYMLKAAKVWDDIGQRHAWLDMAIAHQVKSTQLRPYLPQGWANLAYSGYLGGHSTAEVNKALNNSIKLGPYEKGTRKQLLNIVLGRWEERTPQGVAWATALRNQPRIKAHIDIDSWLRYYRIDPESFR